MQERIAALSILGAPLPVRTNKAEVEPESSRSEVDEPEELAAAGPESSNKMGEITELRAAS